jgi:hypothetical protein
MNLSLNHTRQTAKWISWNTNYVFKKQDHCRRLRLFRRFLQPSRPQCCSFRWKGFLYCILVGTLQRNQPSFLYLQETKGSCYAMNQTNLLGSTYNCEYIWTNIYSIHVTFRIYQSLSRPCYLSREDHNRKIRTRKQKTDIGKYSFENRTIINWN